MRSFLTVACAALLLTSFAGPLRAQEHAALPADVRRVVFLGDSITYAGQYVADIETYFVTRYPGRRIEFVNAGLPSETVSGLSEKNHAGGAFPRPDLHERLARVLAQTKPDLVFACYGMNDGIYQPYDKERFQKYQDGVNWLRDQVTGSGAKIIVVTPPTFDGQVTHNLRYVDVLNLYADWLLCLRGSGWNVVDLHGPMNRFLEDRRIKEPAYAYDPKGGVHPDDLGHWVMARQILLYLGGKDIAEVENAEAMAAVHPNGMKIFQLVKERQTMMKDAWLNSIGHQRPGMAKGLPLEQAQAKASVVETQIRAFAAPTPN